jgi:hypothetical protein
MTVDPDDLVARLRHAITTASNDDLSAPGTDLRVRHCMRIATMQDAVDALTALNPAVARLLAETQQEAHLAGVKDGWNLGIVRNYASFAAIFDEAKRTPVQQEGED